MASTFDSISLTIPQQDCSLSKLTFCKIQCQVFSSKTSKHLFAQHAPTWDTFQKVAVTIHKLMGSKAPASSPSKDLILTTTKIVQNQLGQQNRLHEVEEMFLAWSLNLLCEDHFVKHGE